MRVLVAGGTGVLGRRLVPRLAAKGYEVSATTTSAAKLDVLARLGAQGIVMDGLDAASVRTAVEKARPDVIVHQMTALGLAHAGKPNLKSEAYFENTNRLRTEGTDHLLAAAEAAGVAHIVAQSNTAWNGSHEGGWARPEEEPLELHAGPVAEKVMKPIRHLEVAVLKAGGAVLRYGWFYGPGATDDQVELLKQRKFPQVGAGTGVWSWLHLDDAAVATVMAVEQKARGVFNIVDDEPAEVREWLPYLAECAGAKRPLRVPRWLGRVVAGELAVKMMTEVQGSSNAKARRELGWEPRYPSWRQGFREALA